MTVPAFSMRELLEAGVHFGHHPRRWNPKMSQYIFGVRNGVHIIDLEKTVPLLHQALEALKDVVAKGGRVLFVGTKRQAADKIAEVAQSTGQYYVNHRWLGGMLTNWGTISKSIRRLDVLEDLLAKDVGGLTKKERLKLEREQEKLFLTLGGIRTMAGRPDIICVIDCDREALAVTEANKLGVPVIAVVDTNVKFDGVDYVIPGNDDASRAIELYCRLFAGAVFSGLQVEATRSGVDIGASDNPSEDEGLRGKKGHGAKSGPKVEVVKKISRSKKAEEDEASAEKETMEEALIETSSAEVVAEDEVKETV
jgi:small subunit ribosomal protein S2